MTIKEFIKAWMKKRSCTHRWETHAKNVIEYDEKEVVEGTHFWHRPVVNTFPVKETNEVLICEDCGKIETLNY